MKQDIRLTVNTTVAVGLSELVKAVEDLSVKVTDIEIGQPYDRAEGDQD